MPEYLLRDEQKKFKEKHVNFLLLHIIYKNQVLKYLHTLTYDQISKCVKGPRKHTVDCVFAMYASDLDWSSPERS